MINKRIFSANVGEPSTGNGGPDAIEQDIDNLLANDQELNLKISWKALNYKTEASKPSDYPNEQTTLFVATQPWQGVANVIIKTEKYNDNMAIQYLQPNGNPSTPLMYRRAISTTDTWTNWRNIVDVDMLKTKAVTHIDGYLKTVFPSGGSLNNLPNGIYDVTEWTNITDYPTGAYPFGQLIVQNSLKNGLNVQIYIPNREGVIYYRQGYDANYGTWYQIATSKQPDWITATLQNGWTGSFQYRKNKFGQLEYRFNITAGTVGSYTQILVLPLEYRTVVTPNGNVWFDIPLINRNTADKAYFYYDGGTGAICVSPVVPFTTGSSFAGAGVIPLG